MAIKLEELYKEVLTKYGVKLLTKGFYDKSVKWVHDIEDDSFAHYLRGDELILNSSMSEAGDNLRKRMLSRIIDGGASCFLIPTKEEFKPSDELIQFCDDNKFPLLWGDYDMPFIDINHDVMERLIFDEKNEKSRIIAFKNAIFSPEKTEKYEFQIAKDDFFAKKNYKVVIIGFKDENSVDDAKLDFLEKSIRSSVLRNVFIRDGKTIVMLTTAYSMMGLKTELEAVHSNNPDVLIAIGDNVDDSLNICDSYRTAMITYNIIPRVDINPLAYAQLGVYKLLYKLKDDEKSADFVDTILGSLIEYDEKNGTDYLRILKVFMENECSISGTADALFFHRNTVKYKIAEIKNILGYDVSLNANRFKIIMAFHLLGLAKLK